MSIDLIQIEGVTPSEAIALQEQARRLVRRRGSRRVPRTIAGVDVSIVEGRSRAAIVVLDFPGLQHLATAHAEQPVSFPYVPGLLAFREVPIILEAYERLELQPDVLMVDGHGLAHPRRFGLACHLGVALDLPSLGVGKTLFVGEFRPPGQRRGCNTRLVHRGEVIGRAVRTRDGVNPVFVSIGHRMDLDMAVRIALRCSRKYRLPEPIRAAHGAAGDW